MNKCIKNRNSREVKDQLERAEFQKNKLIKNIYKEYETYFQIVRDSLLTSVEKGIYGLYSDLSISDKELKLSELDDFLNINISLLVNSKLPLITIEQLNLEDVSETPKKLNNVIDFRELIEFKEFQTIDFNYEDNLITKESPGFHVNNYLKTYEYYESLSEDKLSSVNLDEGDYLNSFSKQNTLKKFEDEKRFNSYLELIEEINNNKFNDIDNENDKYGDFFISNNNLNFFEFIDKSFSNLLLNLSYQINSELFKTSLINKIISEDTFKYLSNNNHIIKHPYPFVIKYDLNTNSLSLTNYKTSDIFLFNINNVELEFYNLDLSICRNNINQLKNKFKLLHKKQRYWKHKELTLNDID